MHSKDLGLGRAQPHGFPRSPSQALGIDRVDVEEAAGVGATRRQGTCAEEFCGLHSVFRFSREAAS